MRYQGGQEEVGVDGVSLSKGGADEGISGIGKVIFVESSLGESAIVIRDGELLTSGGNPPASWPGILLCLLLLDFCSVSPASHSLLILFLMLLADASAFVLEVPKGLHDVGGMGVLHVDTDPSVCVTLVTMWGGVSDLGGRGVCPKVGEGCEEGVGSLCEPIGPSSVAVCMDISVMGESGGGVKDLEHITLALLLVLFSGVRIEY